MFFYGKTSSTRVRNVRNFVHVFYFDCHKTNNVPAVVCEYSQRIYRSTFEYTLGILFVFVYVSHMTILAQCAGIDFSRFLFNVERIVLSVCTVPCTLSIGLLSPVDTFQFEQLRIQYTATYSAQTVYKKVAKIINYFFQFSDKILFIYFNILRCKRPIFYRYVFRPFGRLKINPLKVL